jgi:hypothetical protein
MPIFDKLPYSLRSQGDKIWQFINIKENIFAMPPGKFLKTPILKTGLNWSCLLLNVSENV